METHEALLTLEALQHGFRVEDKLTKMMMEILAETSEEVIASIVSFVLHVILTAFIARDYNSARGCMLACFKLNFFLHIVAPCRLCL